MNRVDIHLDDQTLGGEALVGHLVQAPGRSGDTVRFEYAPEWLDGTGPIRPFALDPELALVAGAHYARTGADTLTAVFADCSPDRWGKRLMDRRETIEAREQGRPVRTLRAWDYLAGVDDETRMGALRLVDPASGRYLDDRALGAPPVADLRELEAIAAHVERDDSDDSGPAARWIRQLVAPGTSLGGARPKASFRDQGRLWLAKFPSNDDRHDVGLWEFVTHRLAIDAGIEMPEARLMSLSSRGHTFAAVRFDRSQDSRRMFSSAMTRLDATASEEHGYLDLVEVIETTGASGSISSDLQQLFRRVLFNILVGNRDDHLRNHGFLRFDDGWRLSPAYDVNPNIDRDNHVLAIDASDPSPRSEALLATADYYRLARNAIVPIIDQVRTAVARWERVARELGARSDEISLMQGVIDPGR